MRPIKLYAKETQRQDFTHRLRGELLRTGRTLSPTALARELNLYLRLPEQVHPSSCRKWLHAEAIPTQEKLLLLTGLLKVSPEWLRFGQSQQASESMVAGPGLSADEQVLLETWRQLDKSQQRTVKLLLGQLRKPRT